MIKTLPEGRQADRVTLMSKLQVMYINMHGIANNPICMLHDAAGQQNNIQKIMVGGVVVEVWWWGGRCCGPPPPGNATLSVPQGHSINFGMNSWLELVGNNLLV